MESERPSPADLIEAHQRKLDEQETIPDGVSLMEAAELVARGKVKVTPQQIRMLIELLPYHAPRLSAVAVGSVTGQDFARMLDAAILRSGKAQEVGQLELKAIDVTPAERPNEAEAVSAAHQQQSFPRPRRR